MAGATVTWSSGDTSVATVDAAGLVTAVAEGTATITASGGSASGAATVTVAQEVSTVAVSPAADTLVAGDTLRLAAEATDANRHPVAEVEVAWASSDTLVAVVDGAGLVTAVRAGEAEVSATAAGITGRAELTVVPPAPTSVAVTPDTVALTALGHTVQLTAEVRDQNARVMAGATVTWSSGDTSVATVDAAGLVTAVAEGTATVTASAGSASGSAVVTVMPSVATVEVSPSAETLAVGATVQLTAEAFDANGHAVTEAEFSWESSDIAIATVDASGLVTGLAEGTATITASSGSAQGTAAITVASVTQSVATVEVSPSAETLAVGATVQLTAEAFDANGHAVAEAEFSWESSDIAIATVDASGLVTGLAEGTATITASSGSAQGTAAITVINTVASSNRGILEAFYHAMGGPNWGNSENWLTDAPLGDWHGVRTDASGRVVALRLGSNGLTGSIPPELGSLASLESMDLSSNELTGPIPAEIGDLANLETLDLGFNELAGPIPAELGNLSSLTRMWLSYSGVIGSIPGELGNLSNLTHMRLGSNGLTGPIPPELGSLASLESMDLSSNELTGPIPAEIGDLANLETLDLGFNELAGPIPAELGSLSSLTHMWLMLQRRDRLDPR